MRCFKQRRGNLQHGKKARQPEADSMKKFFHSIEVPILGKIQSPGTLEGGDVVWINEKTIAGLAGGYRTNKEGIEQLKLLLSDQVETI